MCNVFQWNAAAPMSKLPSVAGLRLPVILTVASLSTHSTTAVLSPFANEVIVVVVVIFLTSIASPDSGASVNVNVVPDTA